MRKSFLILTLIFTLCSHNSWADQHLKKQEFQNALDNLNLTLTQARGVPYFRNGKQVGLRLFYIKAGSIYDLMGLKNNDIVFEIDGKPYGDVLSTITSLLKLPQGSNEKVIKIDREQKLTVLKILLDK